MAQMNRRPAVDAAPAGPSGTKSKGGRPPKTYIETEDIRSRLKTAAAKEFAEKGYHGMSVEGILAHSGLSRPTFYRHFANVDEVIGAVLTELNARLIQDVRAAVSAGGDPVGKAEAGLMAWRKWGEWVGPMLPSIYAQLHNPNGPVRMFRSQVVGVLCDDIDGISRQLGRAPVPRILVETFIVGVEYLGYRFHCGEDAGSPQAWAQTREAMLRMVIGLLGSRPEWAAATQLAQVLSIELDRPASPA